MPVTSLDRQVFIARAAAFIGARYNKVAATSSDRLNGVLADVQRYVRYNEEDGIPAAYGLTAYGLGWSIETGRINGQTHIALKAMTTRRLLALVQDLHSHCANMGEMPAYLMGLNL